MFNLPEALHQRQKARLDPVIFFDLQVKHWMRIHNLKNADDTIDNIKWQAYYQQAPNDNLRIRGTVAQSIGSTQVNLQDANLLKIKAHM
ncbi:MAG: hypothetical protein ACJATV_000219 [Granulosicoccus sp.]